MAEKLKSFPTPKTENMKFLFFGFSLDAFWGDCLGEMSQLKKLILRNVEINFDKLESLSDETCEIFPKTSCLFHSMKNFISASPYDCRFSSFDSLKMCIHDDDYATQSRTEKLL